MSTKSVPGISARRTNRYTPWTPSMASCPWLQLLLGRFAPALVLVPDQPHDVFDRADLQPPPRQLQRQGDEVRFDGIVASGACRSRCTRPDRLPACPGSVADLAQGHVRVAGGRRGRARSASSATVRAMPGPYGRRTSIVNEFSHVGANVPDFARFRGPALAVLPRRLNRPPPR